MAFDPTTFGTEEQTCGVYRATRPVDTPRPATSDGSGYTTEKNHATYYRHGDEYLCVRKVSDRGWSVWRYTTVDGEPARMQRHGHALDAQTAQRRALRTAIERSQS